MKTTINKLFRNQFISFFIVSLDLLVFGRIVTNSISGLENQVLIKYILIVSMVAILLYALIVLYLTTIKLINLIKSMFVFIDFKVLKINLSEYTFSNNIYIKTESKHKKLCVNRC